MKRTIILFLLGLSIVSASGQQMKFDWISQAGGPEWDIVTSINELPNGQIMLGGTYYSSIIFGNDTLVSKGSRDIFIARYSPNGTLKQVTSIGGSGYDYAKIIEPDSVNGIILPIKFYEELEISQKKFQSDMPVNILLSWLDESLELTKSFMFSATKEFDITDLENAGDGSCYFSGWFTDSLQVKQTILESQSEKDIFIGKISKLGELEWLRHLKGEGNDIPNSIDQHISGEFFLSGVTSKGCFGEKLNPTRSQEDIKYLFTAEIDSTGQIKDVQYHVQGAEISPVDFLVDSTNVWILANFKGKLSQPGKVGETLALGKSDALLLKYSLSNKTLEQCQIAGVGSEIANSLVKSGENLLITGQYSGKINFGTTTIESGAMGTDMFIAMVSEDCTPVNVFTLSGENNEFPCTAFASNSGVFVSGEFKGEIKIGDGELLSAGKEDIFIARVENCNARMPLKIESTLIDDNTNEPIWELDAGANFVNYSWNSGLSGSRYLVAIEPGKYSVTTKDFFGCSYTAEIELSFEKSANVILAPEKKEFKIYPTVTSGIIHWEPASIWANKQAKVKAFDASGKVILSQELSELMLQPYKLNLSGETDGTYLIEISGDGFREVTKVMVKK